jgi:HlyD family secretion protein
MRWLKRHLRLILAVLVVAGIVAVALWPQSMEVDAVAAARGPMQVTIDEEGETRVRDRFVVSAPVTGRLQRIELEPGDEVVRGKTLLAQLLPAASPLLDARTRGELSAAVDAARAAVGQAQAERDRAAAALERARTTLKRQAALAEAGAVARDTLEAAQTSVRTLEEALRAAQFTVERAEYELQLARARLQAPSLPGGGVVPVIAPVDGVVLRRLRESEATVPAGEPLLEIGDPSRIEVVSDLLSTDAVRVPPGAPVIIEQWGGSHPLQGVVRRVEPSGFMKVSALGVEEQRVNVLVDVPELPPEARQLGDGYRVEIRVVMWQADDVVKLPVGALFRRGDGWAVFLIEDGVARLRTVQVGQRNDIEAQIVGGLDVGQPVVLHPPDTLTDGTRVVVRGAAS